MFEMRFLAALVLLTAAECRLPLEGQKTCRPVNNGPVGGQCPITLSSVPSKDLKQRYSECITLRVWMKDDDFSQSPKIEIFASKKLIFRPTLREKRKKGHKAPNEDLFRCGRHVPKQSQHYNMTSWELVYNCSRAEANREFSATYRTNSTNCSVTYTVREPRPDYSVSVNKSSKTISVSVESGDKVNIRLCYEKKSLCTGTGTLQQTSQSALFQIPYLLPCVCVEVFHKYQDAWRHKKCPFQNGSLMDVGDVLRASAVKVFKSNVTWTSKCPNSKLNISASLCWKQSEHLCVPVFNSTLDKRDGPTLIFNTSAVDKHPQMCVQFSTQGSRNISCLFQDIVSPWETYIGPGRQSISVFLTSSSPAKFSAQLCVLTERGCTPMGAVHSVTVEINPSEKINVPVYSLAERPCVQVWQSHPALHGRRILCPDYTHNRWGVYAAAALLFLTAVALLGCFIHRVTKNGGAGWLIIQKPLLLVCSSEDSTHVSAVCALASLLQEELGATVHTALWAQSSQRLAGSGPGVADLGPLPWLYGQWEAVRKAQGKVLIVWSPEAKSTYLKWREERANIGKNEGKKEACRRANVTHEKIRVDEDLKLNGRKLGKCKKNKFFVEFWDDEDRHLKKESSTVIEPVFVAALTSLEGALQDCKAQGVAIVYFQGLCHNRDIPKALRGVPRYCLLQDLSGLIQELGEVRKGPKTGEFSGHCWPRLLSKVLSIWLARQLAQRLQALLPQMQGRKGEELSVT